MSIARENNNGGNVKSNGWEGEIGTDAQGHAVFDCDVNGLVAMLACMAARYCDKRSPQKSLKLMIGGSPKAEPPFSDAWTAVKKDQREYCNYVARMAGIDAEEDHRLFHSRLAEPKQYGAVNTVYIHRLYKAIVAMVRIESGGDYIIPTSAYLWAIAKYQAKAERRVYSWM